MAMIPHHDNIPHAPTPFITRILIALSSLVAVFCALMLLTQVAVAQGPARKYSYPHVVHSADFAPGETLVALIRTIESDTPGGASLVDVLETWDFKNNSILASIALNSRTVPKLTGAKPPDPLHTPRFVRFSPDGDLLFAYVDGSFQLYRARDLFHLRAHILQPPPGLIATYELEGRAYQRVDTPLVQAMEVSPDGNAVAFLWTRGSLFAQLDIYGTASGERRATWVAPQGWAALPDARGLAWATGDRILVAVPNESPCGSPGSSPDVHVVDANRGTTILSLRTGLQIAGIAVTSGGDLLAVDGNCVGLFKNHRPRLRVFDFKSGKRVRELLAKDSGIRYAVATGGGRAAAWTSDVRCHFDWLDMACFDDITKPQLTIWDTRDYKVLVDIFPASTNRNRLKLSSRGHFLLIHDASVEVFSLP